MGDEKNFLKNEQHILDEFSFKNGSVIENAKVDYAYVGTPKYDEEGNIINAILFCHRFNGDYSSISDFHQLFGEGKVSSKENYFIISITSLGFPESCSPSNTGLKYDFPNYCVEDLVNFKRRLLEEKFPEIKKLHGIIGHTIGGYEALAWAMFYPDEMDFAIIINSSFRNSGHKYIYSKLVKNLIDSSQQYYSDTYANVMSEVLIIISKLHFFISFSKDYLDDMSPDKIDVMESYFEDRGLFYDIWDIKLRNDFLIEYDLEDYLDRIKCNLLIIGVDNNGFYDPKFDSIPIHEAVENSEFILLDIGNKPEETEYLYKIEDDIKKFLEKIERE